jgi:nucleotide-binding universal stress UspA family protein
MIALKKLLVATDFSEPSDAALAYGRELAGSFDAQLVVLHVVDNLLTRAAGGMGADGFVSTDPDLQTSLEAAGKKRVDELISDDDRTRLRAQGVIVTSNAPAVAIVEYAKGADVNLIVIGTHGRGAMAHLLLGSVAERVVRLAPCPVLTVRHPEREFVLPDESGIGN